MSSLKVVLTHPHAAVSRSGEGPADANRQSRARLERPDNASLLHVTDVATEQVRFTAERGLTSSDEIYYSLRPDGRLLVSDSFRAMLAEIPVAERSVPEASIADHLLFRTTPGTQTYLEGVHRLGHGDRLEWDSRSGELNIRRGGRLAALPALDAEAALRQLDGALEAALGEVERDGGWCNLLSGGIDSTLIHSYLGAAVPSASAAIDSPEFAPEVDYARAASALLGTRHTLAPAREADYLTDLEGCIEALGLPPHHLQTVLLDHAIRTAGQPALITGQLADALFGLGSSLLAHRAWKVRHLLRVPGSTRVASALGPAWKNRIGRWQETNAKLALPPEHPDSFAMGFAVFCDVAATAELLGEELVRERLEARLQYVLDRVELSHAAAPPARQLELGHWIDFYCDDTVSIWRQLAHARGKRLLAPFTAGAVARAAQASAVATRYIHHGEVKPVLKKLLSRRLPVYPVYQQKGGSGLPVERYFTGGPLRSVLSDYPMPDFLDERTRMRLRSGALPGASIWLAWNAAVFSIWQERVLRHHESISPAYFVLESNDQRSPSVN
jgi:hypothetical protein